ncbi:DUF6344 domain-containing protein [Streptomyces sp. NPDC048664]|uniref:DUF6344 domain-containing protein n=1 Tax=Streptomyces sp. NPDC048664 TaxID=3154505 RepID=UPI00344A32A6
MALNKVSTLWNAVVTAFLALCTALGLITTTAGTQVTQPDPERNSGRPEPKPEPAPEPELAGGPPPPERDGPPRTTVTLPTQSRRTWAHDRALPPTMRQRISAEAHGSSPAARSHQPAPGIPAPAAPSTPLARSALRPRADPTAPHLEPGARLAH